MTGAVKLTPATARELAPGKTLRDHEVKGLQLKAYKGGKSWLLYYRTREGVERRPKLGSFPEMPLSSAREAAKDLKARVARGEDPSADWSRARAEPTVNDLCDKWLERKKGQQADNTHHENTLLIDCHIRPGLGSMRVSKVTLSVVDDFLKDVLNRKYVKPERLERDAKHGLTTAPGAANHVRTLLRTLFNFALENGWEVQRINGQPKNPVAKSAIQHIAKRKRLAEPHELTAILSELGRLEAEYPAHVAAIWTLFFSGGRVGEIEQAKTSQLSKGHLTLERHKTYKHIDDKKVHIPAFVRQMIEKLPVTKGDRLFGEIALKRIWDDIRTKAGCPDLQMRDARRTFASYALKAGFTLDAFGKLLGHTETRTTSGYSWLIEGDGESMVEKIAETMLSAVNASPPV
jgi:integrase